MIRALLFFGLLGLGQDEAPVSFSEAERQAIARLSPLPEPPPDPTNRVADDRAAARYGQRLFFEKGFSADGQIACATCHDPERSFTDGRPVAETLGKSTRHTPHLWNVAYGRWFFWDGRADSLWAQALDPIENPIEMRGSRLRVARVVLENAALRREHEAIFGPLPEVELPVAIEDARPVPGDEDHPQARSWHELPSETRIAIDRVFVDVAKALAAYERQLISRDSPFDRLAARLAADDPPGEDLLDASAQRGLKLFVGKGECTLCHHGPNLSDGEFHRLRLPTGGGFPKDAGRWTGAAKLQQSRFRADGELSDAPEGERAARTRRLRRSPETWGEFKTPTLRQVAETAPYMHAGQFATLRDVLKFYSTLEGASHAGHHQEITLTPRQFTEEEIDDLIAFLESLTGAPLPEELLRKPE